MNRKPWLVVIVIGMAVGAYYCRGQVGPSGHTVEGFLSDTGQTVKYDRKLVVSLCQLEVTTEGLDSTKRLCPTGDPKEVDIPTYPPKDSLKFRDSQQ
jgi:hypothetical protein